MGDVGDYWREHREYKRTHRVRSEVDGAMVCIGGGGRRRATLVKFAKKHEAAGFRRCSDWHWQATVSGELLDYWPSKNKWRYRGATTTGTEKQLLELVLKALLSSQQKPTQDQEG